MTCIQGAERLTTELWEGGKQGHRCLREGRQAHAVQAERQGHIPDTLQGFHHVCNQGLILNLNFENHLSRRLLLLLLFCFLVWLPTPAIIFSQNVWNIIALQESESGTSEGIFL